MKKLISIFLSLFVVSNISYAVVIEHTNTVNLVLANVCDGTFNDFKFQMSGYDNQKFVFNFDRNLSDISCQFRITKPIEGTVYLDVPASEITASGTSVTWSISRTNIPPPGTYYGELLSYDIASTNIYRSLAQGKLPITWSLYLNETNYFQRTTTNAAVGQVYVHPNWINPPWLTTNDTPSALYYTIAKGNTLSAYVDSVNGYVDNIKSNTGKWESAYGWGNHSTNGYITNYTETDPAWVAQSNSVISNNNLGVTAYGWGNHADAGYVTSSTNIFNGLYSADRSALGTNLSGLTQGTYTGAVDSIAYTGVTVLVEGRVYAWGFTKQNSYGTSTLSIASFSLTKTASGAESNYFTFAGTDSNLVLRLDGDGSSKSDVTGVYVQQITNGDMNVAHNMYVGGTLTVAGKTNVYVGDPGTWTNLSQYNNDLPGLTTNLSDYNNDVGYLTNEPTFLASVAYGINAAGTTRWEKAATDGATATNETAVLRGATNSLQTQIDNIGANLMYRYAAMTNANEQVEVFATGTNIVCTRTNTTLNVSIPSGVKLLSMRVRWDGVNNGSSFNLVLGTNDMTNASAVNRWGAVFAAYREDTGALIAGASCRLDTSNYDTLIIQGLSAATINHCRFNF